MSTTSPFTKEQVLIHELLLRMSGGCYSKRNPSCQKVNCGEVIEVKPFASVTNTNTYESYTDLLEKVIWSKFLAHFHCHEAGVAITIKVF